MKNQDNSQVLRATIINLIVTNKMPLKILNIKDI